MAKHFSEDVKRQAVDLKHVTEGATYQTIADDLGISTSALNSWVLKYPDTRRPHTLAVQTTGESDAVIALRAEITKLKTERDILRQAAKCFAAKMNWPLPVH